MRLTVPPLLFVVDATCSVRFKDAMYTAFILSGKKKRPTPLPPPSTTTTTITTKA